MVSHRRPSSGNDALFGGSFIVSGIVTSGQQKRQEHNQPKVCISSSNHPLPPMPKACFHANEVRIIKNRQCVCDNIGIWGRHPSEPCLTAWGPAKLPPRNGTAGNQIACRN